MSLRDEVNRASTGYWKKASAAVFVAVLGAGSYFMMRAPSESPQPNKKVFVAKIADLKNFVDAEGKVTLSNEWALDFPISGTVAKIYKKPGDTVRKGELIAELDSAYFDIAIDKAEIALKLAEANYAIKARVASVSDVRISEGQFESATAAYDSVASQSDSDEKMAEESFSAAIIAFSGAYRQAEISALAAKAAVSSAELDVRVSSGNLNVTASQEVEKYENSRNRLIMETGQMVSVLQKNLYDMDALLGVTQANRHYNDAFEAYLSAKDASRLSAAQNGFSKANAAFADFYAKWSTYRKAGTDVDGLDALVIELRNAASLSNQSLAATVEVLKSTVESQAFKQESIDSSLSSFENALAASKSETAAYALSIQSVSEAKTSMEVKILLAQNALDVSIQKRDVALTNLEKSKSESENALETAKQKISQARLSIETARQKKTSLLAKEAAQVEISRTQVESKKLSDPVELEPFRIAVESAKKALEEANQKKQDVMLSSPSDGKIANVAGIEGGSSSGLKAPFVTVISTGTFFVRADVDEETVPKVSS